MRRMEKLEASRALWAKAFPGRLAVRAAHIMELLSALSAVKEHRETETVQTVFNVPAQVALLFLAKMARRGRRASISRLPNPKITAVAVAPPLLAGRKAWVERREAATAAAPMSVRELEKTARPIKAAALAAEQR